ncbi:unnamed protein product [Arabidopsis lyrata]|uniref:Expressed protein n=1 Tax=Arabidopsis lyrata subsp. lyrata TaxID=81972 RepID=D7M804_ARALL|nr:expressed protein [Arabidopsis lyrata subsp. lyrata]CAH8269871.1 unnamed protein product [Arabidopsis lyrata]
MEATSSTHRKMDCLFSFELSSQHSRKLPKSNSKKEFCFFFFFIMARMIGPVETVPAILVYPVRVSASPSLGTIYEEDDE